MQFGNINNADMTGGSRQTVKPGACALSIEQFDYKERDHRNPKDSGEGIFVHVTMKEHVDPMEQQGSPRKISFTGLDTAVKGPLQWGRIRELLSVLFQIDVGTLTPGADVVQKHGMQGEPAAWFTARSWDGLVEYVMTNPETFKGSIIRADSFEKPTKSYNPETKEPYKQRIWAFQPYTG